MKRLVLILLFFLLLMNLLPSCATQGAIRAEEYFSIGMAYYDLGNYAEAERWLLRARQSDRTMIASEYNLGRIAFETGRYEEASLYFESILIRDPDNLMALRSAAYSRIHNGDYEKALDLYSRILILVPESADDGYNHALVLYSMEMYQDSENVLLRYPLSLEVNPATILLLARVQKAQDKIEAIDSYAHWVTLSNSPSSQGLFEYAEVLEGSEFYARALEQYDAALGAMNQDTANLSRALIYFRTARLHLIADPESREGILAFETAINLGYDDTSAIDELMGNERISGDHRAEIQRLLEERNSREQ